jgi:divalent metal cation (Fe/Co/Zn/Cd) transporter
LLDSALSQSEIGIIQTLLKDKKLDYHGLRTRKAGQYRFAELHLEMPEELSLKEVHDICDEIEEGLKARINNLEINIHVEPIGS